MTNVQNLPVIVETPARMDLAGPWVDVDPWRRELGQSGATLNIPISLISRAEVSWRSSLIRVGGPSGSRLVGTVDNLVELRSKDTGARAEIEAAKIEEIEVDNSLRLARAAVARMGIAGVNIATESDAPAGSGVGSSSCMAVSIVWALSLLAGKPMTAEEIIRMARDIETADLDIDGGWQDYYTVYGPGVHFMIWEGGEEGGNLHEQVLVPDGFIGRVNRRVVFVYSGKSRLSGDIHGHVYGAMRESRRGVREALTQMTQQAYDARDAFRRGDYLAICQLVNASWECQRRLHESVNNDEISVLFECALRNGAAAGKAGGAGGGGVLMFLAKDDESRDPLVEALSGCIERQKIEDARILNCKLLA